VVLRLAAIFPTLLFRWNHISGCVIDSDEQRSIEVGGSIIKAALLLEVFIVLDFITQKLAPRIYVFGDKF